MIDGEHVDTQELKSCLADGFTSISTRQAYGISKKEYDRVINSKKNIRTEMSKDAPLYEGDDD